MEGLNLFRDFLHWTAGDWTVENHGEMDETEGAILCFNMVAGHRNEDLSFGWLLGGIGGLSFGWSGEGG